MSAIARVPALTPFRIRSYRFQWPADLATSWAFEMETLILSWYVLVETQSVLLLTVFASLQYIGTLIAPFMGVMADRMGRGNMLCVMRAIYTALASTLMAFAFVDVLTPVHVFVIGTLTGLVRPSDLGMRAALVGDTMPAAHLVGAMSIQRTTMDSARIAGALTGAGLVAALGMGPAYSVIATFYAASFLLTLKVARLGAESRAASREKRAALERTSHWGDLSEAATYVWHEPHLLAALCLAFLVNLTAYPITTGLLPYVAKEIYGTGQTGLGYLVASFSAGALVGSIALSRRSGTIRPARTMIVFCVAWYLMLLVFAFMPTQATGILALLLVGCAQSLGMTPMQALLLRNSHERYRGRIMGLRMLAIYGLPVGLLLSGPLVARFGYPATASVYCICGLALTVAIALKWRTHVWQRGAPANAR
ncbi:MAG: MFS transporter [Burkholderiales bacterium]